MRFGPLTALNLTSGNRAVVDMYVCGLVGRRVVAVPSACTDSGSLVPTPACLCASACAPPVSSRRSHRHHSCADA